LTCTSRGTYRAFRHGAVNISRQHFSTCAITKLPTLMAVEKGSETYGNHFQGYQNQRLDCYTSRLDLNNVLACLKTSKNGVFNDQGGRFQVGRWAGFRPGRIAALNNYLVS
jgi:hypothetical protein